MNTRLNMNLYVINLIIFQKCNPCEAGKECKNTTSPGTVCPPAYYSLGGAVSCSPCPPGYQCLQQDTYPSKCPSGTYTSNSSAKCFPCAKGYVCVEGSRKAEPQVGICKIGYYCPDGKSQSICPAGKYGTKYGAANETDGCAPCPQGYYCEPGTPGYPREYVKCSPGHYCPEGTKTSTEYSCPDGTFSKQIGLVSKSECKDCLPGYYCAHGDRTGDTLCQKGHYCPHNSSVGTKCPSGMYTEERGSEGRFHIRFYFITFIGLCAK